MSDYKSQACNQFKVGQYVRSFDVPRMVVKLVSREGDDPVDVLPYIEGWIRKIGPWDGGIPGATHLHIEVLVDSWPVLDDEDQWEIPARDWVYPVIDNPMRMAIQVIE